MIEIQNQKRYDLEERTLVFTQDVISFTQKLTKNIANIEIIKQLVRSAGSIGANYIEANESFSKKDFILRIKICRREAKETIYWLKLLVILESQEEERRKLIQEATELMKIFGSIVEKSK